MGTASTEPRDAAVTSWTSPGEDRTTRVRLGFLDGIRGLAALYVLVFHELTINVPQDGESLSAPMRALRSVFGYGHYAVCVFIVLSGFSLMLPLARGGVLHLPGGLRPYLWRRVRRLFPPYYAALVLSIVAVLVATHVSGVGSTDESYDAALRPGSVISHLLLVHNLELDWAYRINGPMWSVATEWQIYFLLPLVLLPLWRRIGGVATVVSVWAVTMAIDFALPGDGDLSWAAPWFVGSFALGMWGALSAFSHSDPARRLRSISWGWVALAALGGVVLMTSVDVQWQPSVSDAVVSVFALAVIMACVRRTSTVATGRRGLTALLGSRPLVALGGFSYSLYLLQHPLLRLTERVIGELPVSYEQALLIQLIVGTPLVMAAALLFAEFFELPFTTGGRLVPYLRRRFPSSRIHVADPQPFEPGAAVVGE